MPKYKITVLALSLLVTLTACTATDEYGNKRRLTDTEKGAIIGATLGAIAGHNTRDTKKRILYGIVGGIAGAGVGNYMDSQKKDFEKNLKDEISRGDVIVERLPDNLLMVTMSSESSFDVDSTVIKPNFKSTLEKIAKIVNRYGKTHLSLVGHTDSTGSRSYNQKLSERRAGAIEDYFLSLKVIPQRMTIYGMGEDKPRADNSTAQGRSQNRRVEIIIEPIVAKS
jgi:outer membrane protein OmpA-like peptidoglycan-associated protein